MLRRKKPKQPIVRKILTTEEIAALPRAGLLRRLAALLYDMFLVVAIWFCCGFVLLGVFGLFADNTSTLIDGQVQTHPVLSFLMFLMMVTTSVAFYLWFWNHRGQTLGMIAWRIRALRTDNAPIGPREGMLRWLLAWPAFWCAGLGYLYMYTTPERDALHEKISGTKTVLLPREARPF